MQKQTFFKRCLYSAFLLAVTVGVTTPTLIHAADGKVKLTVTSNLNIYEAKLIKQEGHRADLSFVFVNGKGVQPQVKYGVELYRETPEGNILVDEQVYNETLSLSENTRRFKQISYAIPDELDGTYAIYVNSKNGSGMPLGFAFVDKVTVTAIKNPKKISINKEKCYLSVEKEKDNDRYTLDQGVDILPEENLIATCLVSNTTDADLTLRPVYTTYYRTLYGEEVKHVGGDFKEVTLKKGEAKNLSFKLPKAEKPQAYDVKLFLADRAVSSNNVAFHYVLRGPSATVQNISLDKDGYSKGDTALLNVFWSGAADSFVQSRIGTSSTPESMTIEVAIKNKEGVSCLASPLTRAITKKDSLKAEFTAKITANCMNPQVLVSFKDAKGGIIADAREFSIETLPKEKKGSAKAAELAVIIVTLLGTAALVYYFRKSKLTK